MAGHHFECLLVFLQELSGALSAITMIDAVESIAANAAFEPLIRTRINGRRQRHLPDGSLSFPPLAGGCLLEGVSAAGSYFPQAIANQTDRLDDVLGPGVWLISRLHASGPATASTLRRVALDDSEIAPFKKQLETWLTKQSADAVLVRPDRYVFGAGTAEALQEAWALAAV